MIIRPHHFDGSCNKILGIETIEMDVDLYVFSFFRSLFDIFLHQEFYKCSPLLCQFYGNL